MTNGYQRIKQTSINFVNAMKIGDLPGNYAKEKGGGESLYGSYHAAHILDMFGELHRYDAAYLDTWAVNFQKRQNEFGFFTNIPELQNKELPIHALDPVWHYTRGNIWALRILGRKPRYELKFLEPLLNAGKLYQWVKQYDWGNPWAAGNQICACATALFALRDWFGVSEVDRVMEEGMYPALEELLDKKTGFWGTQYGASLPNGLFGTIHITPVYFAQGWPLKALERNTDSTLACQLEDGSFWPGGSDCPDFDGAYMLANLAALTNYRREDIETAARKYLTHAL